VASEWALSRVLARKVTCTKAWRDETYHRCATIHSNSIARSLQRVGDRSPISAHRHSLPLDSLETTRTCARTRLTFNRGALPSAKLRDSICRDCYTSDPVFDTAVTTGTLKVSESFLSREYHCAQPAVTLHPFAPNSKISFLSLSL
jgi:hypothetical protein